MSRRTDDENLRMLAGFLDPRMQDVLLRLIDADSEANRYADTRDALQRSEALVAEMRRQMRSLERALERAREDGWKPVEWWRAVRHDGHVLAEESSETYVRTVAQSNTRVEQRQVRVQAERWVRT